MHTHCWLHMHCWSVHRDNAHKNSVHNTLQFLLCTRYCFLLLLMENGSISWQVETEACYAHRWCVHCLYAHTNSVHHTLQFVQQQANSVAAVVQIHHLHTTIVMDIRIEWVHGCIFHTSTANASSRLSCQPQVDPHIIMLFIFYSHILGCQRTNGRLVNLQMNMRMQLSVTGHVCNGQ